MWSYSLRSLSLLALSLVLALPPASAEDDPPAISGISGSDGSYGPITIDSSAPSTTWLDLPPDGIIHATTITVASNKTLRFNRNAANTPVVLLATGDVEIIGTINVSGGNGLGGPGGFDGGLCDPFLGGAWGEGPDAGPNGVVSSLSPLAHPLIGGSGGAVVDCHSSSIYGGAGGGAILIASDTEIRGSGSVRARGSGGFSGTRPGGGGTIRLVAPRVSISGFLDADSVGGSASQGVVRVDRIFGGNSYSCSRARICRVSSLLATLLDQPVPSIRIEEVAGSLVPLDFEGIWNVVLPLGSDPQQPVTFTLSNFSGLVEADVVLMPEFGPHLVYPVVVDMGDGSASASFTEEVTFPVNRATKVAVYVRPVAPSAP